MCVCVGGGGGEVLEEGVTFWGGGGGGERLAGNTYAEIENKCSTSAFTLHFHDNENHD